MKMYCSLKRGFWIPAAAAWMMFAATAPAVGQSGSQEWWVAPFVGISLMDGSSTFTSGDVERLFQTEYESGFKAGIRVGANVTEAIGIEGGYSVSDNDFQVTEFEDGEPKREFQINLHRVSGNALFFLDRDAVDARIFLTGGIGATVFAVTDQARDLAFDRFIDAPTRIESSTLFTVNVGGGFEAPINDWLGYRVEFRDHISPKPSYGLPEAPLTPDGVFLPTEGLLHSLELSIGLVLGY